MEGRSLARPARRLVVSVVPVTLGVTIDVPGMLVSTTTVLGRIENGATGTVVVTFGAMGEAMALRRRAGHAPVLPSIYGRNDTLCKSEHF